MSNSLQAINLSPTSLESYLNSIQQFRVLEAEEEHALAVRFAEDNDLQAARQLVLSNLRFVVHVARGYDGYGLSQADLIQEGNVGLMKAVKRFNPAFGVRLISFAVHWIKAEIHEFIIKNWRIVKVATTKAQRKLFFNLRKTKKRLGWFSQSEVEQVAEDLGVAPKTVMEMEARLQAQDEAFDGASEDEDKAFSSPKYYLEDKSPSPEAVLVADDWQEQAQQKLVDALDTLDERSRAIISARWLTEKKQTLQVLAKQYDISVERVRQIESAAIKQLKTAVSEE